MAEGRWKKPASIRRPTGEEQAEHARRGRLREVAEGRWRNPALEDVARMKLSRPRVHGDDPTLHRALEKLRGGEGMEGLTDEEREAHRRYRRELAIRKR